MTQPFNTPPDGDFASYIERLTASNARDAAQPPDIRKPASVRTAVPVPNSSRAPASTGQLPTPGQQPPSPLHAAVQPFTGRSLFAHLKWLVAAWIGISLLSIFVSGAGWLFLPVATVYVAWVIFRLNENSEGDLVGALRQLAGRAAEEARKAQQVQIKKK